MPRIETLDLKFTPEAKARVLRFLASITDYPPTLTLMKGRTSPDPVERWGYGAYAPRNIEVVAPEVEQRGYALLYSFDELTVAIPQFHLIPELKGKTLDLGERGLVLKERTHGI